MTPGVQFVTIRTMKRVGVILPDEVVLALRDEAQRRGLRSLPAYVSMLVLGMERAERDAAYPRGTERSVRLDAMPVGDRRRESLAREWMKR